MATYDVGDKVRVTATFTQGGTGTDPFTIVATHRKPDGTDTDVTSSVDDGETPDGIYDLDVTLDQVGTHTIRFKGTEGVIAAEVIELEVAKSVFDHS